MSNLSHLQDIGFSETAIKRFWKHANRGEPDSCWVWSGAKFVSGYGKLEKGSKPYGPYYAHRVSWIIHNGPIEPGKHVCHRCDNPPCVNPSHLWLGSMSQNIIDKVAKGRGRWVTKLTKQDITSIRLLSKTFNHVFIARVFSVHQSQISRIISGKQWSKIHDWVP